VRLAVPGRKLVQLGRVRKLRERSVGRPPQGK
jgi:hypothetical protein